MKLRSIAAALIACSAMTPTASVAQLSVGISVRLAPPPLPVYAQPPLPGPDYLWTPGYWAWDDYAAAYYWVPGTWVRAPYAGLLWTPPWWGWSDGAYIFHTGYWGTRIGFYGGVAYGFGYTGFGYQGGYWNGGHLFYNRTVNNITNIHVTNVYQSNVTNVTSNRVTHVSYNGGPGGVRAQPRPEELLAARDQHVAPTAHQQDHVQAARADPQAYASANHGRPPVAATPRAVGNQGYGPASSAAAFAPQRADPRRQPGQPHSGGMAPAGDLAADRASQDRVRQPQRFAGRPDDRRGDPRFDAPQPAKPAGRADLVESAFDRAPSAPTPRQGNDGGHVAPPPHGSQPHPPQPPHASKPPRPPKSPHPHPQVRHDDHHHG